MACPRNQLCLLLLGVSDQAMMASNFSAALVPLKRQRKASNGNYLSSPPLTAQLPEFKGTSLMAGKAKQN